MHASKVCEVVHEQEHHNSCYVVVHYKAFDILFMENQKHDSGKVPASMFVRNSSYKTACKEI